MSDEPETGEGARAPRSGRSGRSRQVQAAGGDKASGLFVSPVQIHPDQLIHFIKEQAAEQAAASARDRLNFFFTAAGLVLGLVTAGAAGGLYMINRNTEDTVDTLVEARFEKLMTTLDGQQTTYRAGISDLLADQTLALAASGEEMRRSLDDRFALLEETTTRSLREEVSAVILLPLLVSEATSFANKGSYRDDDRDRILRAMAALAPDIRELEGDARTIAMRRIEDIIDALYNAGDYADALRLYSIFGTELLELYGIQYSMALVFAALLMSEQDAATANAAALEAFLAVPYDHDNSRVRTQMLILHAVRDLQDGGDDATVAERLADAERDIDGFLAEIHDDFAQDLRRHFAPGGVVENSWGLESVERLERAILDARYSLKLAAR